jgi:hypothetical protein
LSLEGLLHCLKAHQRLPHDRLHSGEESCIHGDESQARSKSNAISEVEVCKSESWELELLRWELGGPFLANHLTALELLLGVVHSVTSIGIDRLTSVAVAPLRQKTHFRVPPKLKAFLTAKMPDIEMPDPEELGGNVTKPFKFVTGSYLTRPQI